MTKDCVVIFDLDGTLLNTDLLIHNSFEHVFKKFKPEYILTQEEHLSFLGPLLTDSLGRYFPKEMIKELVSCYREYSHRYHKDYVTIYPTVKDTLKYLKERGYPLAIVTTKLKKDALLGTDLFGITSYFDIIIAGEDVMCAKPDPEGILKVLQETKCIQGVMIGDNKTDIQAGKNAGVYTIGVNWTPKGTQDIQALKPDLMINQMNEIIKFIEGIDSKC